MDIESENLNIGKERIVQVFEYLKALNEHRNPAKRQIKEQPWALWYSDLPDHPAIVLGAGLRSSADSDDDSALSDEDFVLRVRRPKITPSPSPPDELRSWLRSGWEEPENAEIRWYESKNEIDDEGETVVVSFEDDPTRLELLESWRATRELWRVNELPARRAMRIFERLYELHGRMERESERLDFVLGDGILSWKRQDGGIFHPILIQRVQMVFDPSVPEFTIADSDYGVELYTALFQSLTDVDPQALANCRSELERGNYHPLAEDASGYLKRFVMTLSSHGEFIEDKRPPVESEAPVIGRSPVLFLRTRTMGFSTAIEKVLEKVRERSDFCTGLMNIVGVESAPTWEDTSSEETSRSASSSVPATDILFGKEANPEQTRIAQRLGKYGSVLVQGPPGTGKSHTIANLIGHLLAQGKSVLVTSHTTKALRVLRQHVVDELRPLCVSVLDSDLDSRRQLEESVSAISNRLSEADADALDEEADTLAGSRRRIIEQLDTLHGELLKARTDEYRDVVIGGKSLPPSQAARKVAEGIGKHDWIPGPVALGEPLPLSPSELVELYATNPQTTAEDDLHVDDPLPTVDEVLTSAEFRQIAEQQASLSDQSKGHVNSHWAAAKFTTQHPPKLDDLIRGFREAINSFRAMEPWQLAAVDAGRAGDHDVAPWQHLLGKIEEAQRCISEAKLDKINHAPEVADSIPLEQQRQLVVEIRGHVESGKGLGWFALVGRGTWKSAIQCWRVRGQSPTLGDHFAAIESTLHVKIAREELGLLWDGLMSCNGLPSSQELGGNIEQTCAQYGELIQSAIVWWETTWIPLVYALKSLGFDWDRFNGELPPSLGEYGPMKRVVDGVEKQLLPNLSATTSHLRSLYLRKKLKLFSEQVSRFSRSEVNALRAAIEHGNVEDYDKAYQTLVGAISRQQHAQRRRALLRRLEGRAGEGKAVAETWATHVRNRLKEHGQSELPGDPATAWEWRQLCDELDRRAAVNIEEILATIEDLNQRLKNTTVKLIDCRAWSRQVRRTTLRQRHSLMGWLDTVRRIGRGFGKRAPQLRVEARRKMSDCRDAVPVWIMPVTRLVENFDFHSTQFDVVIIDEASQCDVMALLALAIAKQVVVVGDHEQVSPSAVGQDVNTVQNLIRLHLQGIPNSDLYDGKLSIYDLARQSFGGTICLQEHFRCVPDIIQFSNYLSYNRTIKPLRDDSSSPVRPAVIPFRVDATSRSGKVNHEEARVVASLVIAAIEEPAYEKQTFGVVSLVGDEQAIEIEKLLLAHLSPEIFEARRIVCGNSAQFQGDERDVMFLSLVDVPGSGPLAMRQQPAFRQRFNVAASRARNQMWVVHSVSPETDLKPGDLRRRLIEHAIDPKAITREQEKAEARAESEFERLVIRRLVQAGYKVVPQWRVGRYRIDIVVEGDEGRLAVECDGDRYHPIEKLPDDMARQAILERLGWKFHRIRGSEFFRDCSQAMERLLNRLQQLGIEPIGQTEMSGESDKNDADEFVKQLARRAAEIRRSWDEDGNAEEGPSPEVGNDLREDASSLPTCSPRSLFSDLVDDDTVDDDTTVEPVGERADATEDKEESLSPLVPTEQSSRQIESETTSPDSKLDLPSDVVLNVGPMADKEPCSTEDEDLSEALPDFPAESFNVVKSNFVDVSADTWFALAHWAKEQDSLNPWDRKFAFSQGIRVKMKKEASEKQASVCDRILREAKELGFAVDDK